MHKLRKILMEQLKEHEAEVEKMGGRMTTSDIEKIHKLTDIIKNIDKIEMLESGESYGYSHDGYSRDGYSRDGYSRDSYASDREYDEEGSSYRRRRDSMGRYARSEGKDRMVEKLHDMMTKASSEKEREALKRCISTLENA